MRQLVLLGVMLGAFSVTAFSASPIKLAIFAFELEDLSATGSSPLTPADAQHMANVTTEVRQLLAQSGRYQLIDVGGAAANGNVLRECDGCDAGIALKLGAEQSLVGVVKRISRTEYTIKIRLRDARTGEIVSDAESELRMGADYSWSRGATRLVKDRLLASTAPP